MFGTLLSDGSRGRWERCHVLGEIKPEYLPEWAKDTLTKLLQQQEEQVKSSGSAIEM